MTGKRIASAVVIAAICNGCSLIGPQEAFQVSEAERQEWRQEVRGLYQPLVSENLPVEKQVSLLLEEYGEEDTYIRLRDVLEDEAIRHSEMMVLPVVKYFLSDPKELERVSRDLGSWAQSLGQDGSQENVSSQQVLSQFSGEAVRLLGAGVKKEGEVAAFPLQEFWNQHDKRGWVMDYISVIVYEAGEMVAKAFAGLTEEEMAALTAQARDLVDELVVSGNGEDAFLETEGIDLADAVARVDYRSLAKAFTGLARLSSPQFVEILQIIYQDDFAGVPGEAIGEDLGGIFLDGRQTPYGNILIGGRGANEYGSGTIVIIDLGGDDIYRGNSGSTAYTLRGNAIESIESPIGVIIDLAGNDQYISSRFGAQGTGLFGVGLLVDMTGNDLYSADQLAQGASLMGIGGLVDMAGDDRYICQEFCQGAALFGAAVLYDGSGSDRFYGAQYAQGVGGPSGIGQLVDATGNDNYLVGGKDGSSYGTPGMYRGKGQGLGWGFRGIAGGGLGVLLDLAGSDVYEAGNFSQGTGYYFGAGLLTDVSGNDRYRGSRYSQGSAAHQAIGILSDGQGDDIYTAQIAANQGASWDVAITGFFDYDGNDAYTAADLSLGAGAQNGFSVFFDAGGEDQYTAATLNSHGYGGPLTYSDGRNASNLAFFIDLGGHEDTYNGMKRKNNDTDQYGDVGIFLDE